MFLRKEKLTKPIETISALFIIAFIGLFILANFLVGFSWPIYLLAMTVAFGLSIFYPRSGLYAIVFLTMVFERFFTLAPVYFSRTAYKLYPLDIIIIAILLNLSFFYFKNFFSQSKNKLKTKFKLATYNWWLILFIIWNGLYFLASIFITKTNSYLAFSSFKNYAFYSLLYFITISLIQNREELRKLGQFFLAGAITIIVFIIGGIIRGEGFWTQFTPLSTSGIRILAFTHGFYLSLALITFLVYLIFSKNKKLEKYFYGFIIIWLIGIIGSMMRHLWIGLFLAILVIYFYLSREKKLIFKKIIFQYFFLIVTTGIFIFYCISLVPTTHFSQFIQKTVATLEERGVSIANAQQDESFAWRELVWKTAYTDFQKHPILGIGTGKSIYVQTQNYRSFVTLRNIHNSYLAIMIQLGLVGLGLLIGFLYQNIKSLIKFLKKRVDQFQTFSLLGMLIVYLVVINFQPYLETNLLAIFFWIILGLSHNLATDKYNYK